MRFISSTTAFLAMTGIAVDTPRAWSATLTDAIGNRPELSKFAAALRATGLEKELSSSRKFTVFAPTDAAIDALPAGKWSALLESKNRSELVGLLKAHISPGNYPSQRLVAAKAPNFALPSLSGKGIEVDRRAALKAGDAALYRLDVAADNGTVHIIDRTFLAGVSQTAKLKSH